MPNGLRQTTRWGSPRGESDVAYHNLSFATTAPRIVVFLNNDQSKTRPVPVCLVNASQVFKKGVPRSLFPSAGIQRVAQKLTERKAEEKHSSIVNHEELKKNENNNSPIRYIRTIEADTNRPIGKIVVKAKQRDPHKKPDEVSQYVDVLAVSNRSFRITGAAPTLGSDAPSRARKATETDEVLFATVRPTLNLIALFPPERDGPIAGTGYCVLRCDKAKAVPRFLYTLLITGHFNARMAGLERGASYPAVRDSDVTASWLPLPPLREQKEIAHILSTVQRAIETQERIIQTTTELKKALMRKPFTKGLRNEPQKQSEIGPAPRSWEVKRFDSFAVLQRGFDITKKDQRVGEYPVVSSGGISSYHDEAKVKGSGVVIARKGSFGTVNYVPSDYWLHDTTLWIKDFNGNNPRFVAYLLEKMRLKRFDTGAANQTLNRNIVHGEKIATPPTDQQAEIGEALEAVESKITIHERRKRSFQNLFRTLLHELMTAKTRVHELDLLPKHQGAA
ncbi:MAG: restriction endonuclease subunit S [Opitutaceae bacterium]